MAVLYFIGVSLLGLAAYFIWRGRAVPDRSPSADTTAAPGRSPEASQSPAPDEPEHGDVHLCRTADGGCAFWQDFWQETVVAVAFAPDGQVHWRRTDLGWASTSSPDGRHLLSADDQDQLVRLDARTGATQRQAPAPAPVYALWWISEQTVVLGTDHGAALWLLDARTLQRLTPEPFRAEDVRRHVRQTGYAPVVDPGRYSDPSYAPAVVPEVAPDAYARSYFESVLPHPTDPALLVVLDTAFGHLLHVRLDTFAIEALYPAAAATEFARPSPDGHLLVQSTLDSVLLLTDAATGQLRRTLAYGIDAAPSGSATCVRPPATRRCALSPDQQWVAVVDGAGQVVLLGLADDAPAQRIRGTGLDLARDVCWLDAHTLLVALDGFRLAAVDAHTGQIRYTVAYSQPAVEAAQ